jgi:Zn-dependent M28 family amino/carboxypeptidase
VRRRWAAAIATGVAVVAISACGSDDEQPATASAGVFDEARAFEDLEAQVEFGPRPAGSEANRRSAEWIAERMREAGVRTVTIQEPWLNVSGTLPGSKPGYVVVGAHHDTKSGIDGFVGANDGASGIAVLLELARSLPRPLPGPSVQLVAFDAEESRGDRPFEFDGMRGSRQFVEIAASGGDRGVPRLDEIKAAIIFDLIGDCDLEIPRERYSNEELHQLFADASAGVDGDPDPFVGTAPPVLDDHFPFAEAEIPALDLIDFEFGPGPSPGGWWHTPEDTVDKVCAESLDAVGEAAVVAIPKIR